MSVCYQQNSRGRDGFHFQKLSALGRGRNDWILGVIRRIVWILDDIKSNIWEIGLATGLYVHLMLLSVNSTNYEVFRWEPFAPVLGCYTGNCLGGGQC